MGLPAAFRVKQTLYASVSSRLSWFIWVCQREVYAPGACWPKKLGDTWRQDLLLVNVLVKVCTWERRQQCSVLAKACMRNEVVSYTAGSLLTNALQNRPL